MLKLRAVWARLWARLTSKRRLPELLLDVEAPPIEEPEDEPDYIGLRNAYHIRSLLDRLPTYFEDLHALRKVDETAYGLFSTLGGTLCGDHEDGKGEWLRGGYIPPETLAAPPHVRCLFLNTDAKSDTISPLLYMMRMAGGQIVVTSHGHAALPPGLNYRVVMVYREKGHPPAAEEWFAHIDSEGTAHVLPEMVLERHFLPRTKRARRHGSNAFTRKRIRTEPRLLALASEEKGYSVAEQAQFLCGLVLSAGRPKECVLVRATLGHETAAWTIDRNDAKRFFRQRETGDAADGKRKRVLHYVAPFERVRDGKVQFVREHYRGERAFDWNGYRIEVSGLGFHHTDVFDADLSQYDAETNNQPGMVSLRKATKLMRERYRKPMFLSDRRA